MNLSKLFALGLFIIVLDTKAEIYRWVDENGKVHFTDKKTGAAAVNITKEVKPNNIDTSSNELNKITAMREREEKNRREQLQREQQALQTQNAKQRNSYCAWATERLRKISGYIVFTDEQGRAVTVTEKERAQMVTELKQNIQTNCS